VTAGFGYLAPIEDHDQVRMRKRSQPVREQDYGRTPILRRIAAERVENVGHNPRLGVHVDGRERVVEHQQPRTMWCPDCRRSGETEPLALAAR
jgi:hypothetical protein